MKEEYSLMPMVIKEYKPPGWDHPVFVHHEEDWHGTVIIEWWDTTYRRVEIPARVILMLTFAETKKWIFGELELALDQKMEQFAPDLAAKKKGRRP